jgi:DNA (cytosine-5)-methyltransferase 1
MLMFDVLRFIEVHRYRRVIVENVVDVATRVKYRRAWTEWLGGVTKLGYRYRVISLNSMHAQFAGPPAPQSRDRLYVAMWPEGDRAPDFDKVMRPKAWCPKCEQVVESRQAWKPGRAVGKYRAQYVYLHGDCGTAVEPGWLPAAAAIDWLLPGQRIGDRDKPLADKTRARIAAGIARYWRPFTLEAAGNTFERRPGVRTWPVDDVLMTLHTTPSKALAVPVEGREGKQASPVDEPMRTMTCRNETALAIRSSPSCVAAPATRDQSPTPPGPSLPAATTTRSSLPLAARGTRTRGRPTSHTGR